MHRLKLGVATKYRLHRGAVHPVMTWGAQANGLALQRSDRVSGAVCDMRPTKSDPGDSIILQHIHTVWKVLHSFDESAQNLFWASWNAALHLLPKTKYRRQVVM